MANQDISANLSPCFTLVEQGSTPANPASGNQKVYVKSSDHAYYLLNSSGVAAALAGTAVAPSDVESHLSSDVTLGVNTWTDVLSISLTAGTWLIIGRATMAVGSIADYPSLALYDGTSYYDSSVYTQAVGWMVCITVFYKVSPGSTTTYKIRATSAAAACTALAACPQNGVGNNATCLYALRYG